jgi:acyl-CoA thioesterase FadM
MHQALDLAQFGDMPRLATLSLGYGVDRGGRVHVTCREMHRAVESVTAAFVQAAGGPEPDRTGPIVLRSTVHLLRPLLPLVEAAIHMHASKMGTTSLEARYTLVAPDGGAVARADVLLVWVDAAREQVVSLPESVRRAVLAATPIAGGMDADERRAPGPAGAPGRPAIATPAAITAATKPSPYGRLLDHPAPPVVPDLPMAALPIRRRRAVAA